MTLGYLVLDSAPTATYSSPTPVAQGGREGLAIVPLAAAITVTVAFPLDRSFLVTTLSDRLTGIELCTSLLSLGSLVGLFVVLHSLALQGGTVCRKGGGGGKALNGEGQDGEEEGEEEEGSSSSRSGSSGGASASGVAAIATSNPLHLARGAEGQPWRRGARSGAPLAAVVAEAAVVEEEEEGAEESPAPAPPPPAVANAALLPGWRRAPEAGGSGRAVYLDEGGRACHEAPVVEGLPEGVDPWERFEVVDGQRYFWSDGRRREKGQRGARLLAPGWRRCVRAEDGVWFLQMGTGKMVRRPDLVY